MVSCLFYKRQTEERRKTSLHYPLHLHLSLKWFHAYSIKDRQKREGRPVYIIHCTNTYHKLVSCLFYKRQTEERRKTSLHYPLHLHLSLKWFHAYSIKDRPKREGRPVYVIHSANTYRKLVSYLFFKRQKREGRPVYIIHCTNTYHKNGFMLIP